MRLYLDSNVFISFIRCEIGKGFKLMELKSIDFFDSLIESNHELVLSDLFFYEIEKVIHYSKKEVISFFKKKRINVKIVCFKKNYFSELKKWGFIKIHRQDRVHFFLALKSNSDSIIAWNLKDFTPAKKFINVMEPKALD